MVAEFPDLQGFMGGLYAKANGEKPAVSAAIATHYAPQGPDALCPEPPVSVAVALADKLDTLAGFFAIDERPTGSKDPFALRRAALGVIRLILEYKVLIQDEPPLRLPLGEALAAALAGYDGRAAYGAGPKGCKGHAARVYCRSTEGVHPWHWL